SRDWSSDVCSSDLFINTAHLGVVLRHLLGRAHALFFLFFFVRFFLLFARRFQLFTGCRRSLLAGFGFRYPAVLTFLSNLSHRLGGYLAGLRRYLSILGGRLSRCQCRTLHQLHFIQRRLRVVGHLAHIDLHFATHGIAHTIRALLIGISSAAC